MSESNDLVLIDWEKSIELADNDSDLATDILKLTSRSLPNDIQEIDAAFENNDEREIRRLLHKLEGGISYVKLPRLEHFTLALHKAVRDLDNDNIDPLLNQLRTTIQDTLVAVQERVN